MNCRKCSNKFDNHNKRPYFLEPCCHMFCEDCLTIYDTKLCPECSITIENKYISQDILSIIEKNKRNQIKSYEKLNELEQLNKLLETKYDQKNESIQTKLDVLEKQIEMKSQEVINKINDEKITSLSLVKMISDELFSKLDKIIEIEKQIKVKLNDYYSTRNDHHHVLTEIEETIEFNLKELNNIQYNHIFIKNNTENNYIGVLIENDDDDDKDIQLINKREIKTEIDQVISIYLSIYLYPFNLIIIIFNSQIKE